MNNFDYARATTLQDAIQRSQDGSTQYIAGGTELLNWMRLGISEPARLVDIGFVSDHREIKREGNELVIGALATLNEVGENALVNQHAGALAQACLKAASAQIRNRATLGGNVLQKTRCAYFRSEAPLPWGCNKRVPGSGCAALEGLNERHAIFGWTDACVAVHPSDPLVALACLDATVQLMGPQGPRTLEVRSLHLTQEEARAERSRAPEAQRESRLRPQELIAAYRIPIADGERSAYIKVRERDSYEYALISAAASLQIKDGKVARTRIALGSVAQRPWRLLAAEQALIGSTPDKQAVLAAIRTALGDAKPLEHNRYKITMAANAATRAVLTAGGVA
ncbi:MAG: FAD binding domain-containing protein [Steroidobacteraceae bacterium]